MKKDEKEAIKKVMDSIKSEIDTIQKFKDVYKQVIKDFGKDVMIFNFTLIAHDNLINVLNGEIKILEKTLKA